MEKQIQDEINTLKDIIVNTIPVEQIYLFGSHAYGEPNADSDLDVYVVIPNDINLREIDAVKLLYKAMRGKKTRPVDIVVSKRDKFDRRKIGPTIERLIAQEGVLLYG